MMIEQNFCYEILIIMLMVTKHQKARSKKMLNIKNQICEYKLWTYSEHQFYFLYS